MKIHLLMKRYPVTTSIIITILTFLILKYFEIPGLDDLDNMTLSRIFNAIIILITIYLIAGKEAVTPSTKGILYAFKKSWWALAMPASLALLIAFIASIFEFPIVSNPLVIIIKVTILSISIGIFEEGLFRGLVLNSLLKHLGNNKKGIITAILLSSFIFGLLHIYSNLLLGEINDWITFLGACGKTLQAGILGILFSVIYIRNENLWSIATIHGLNDWFILITTYLLNIEDVDTYVLSGEEGILADLLYVFVLIIMIPIVLTAIKQLRKINPPQKGFFESIWKPQIPNYDPPENSFSLDHNNV